jgi:hypothetical protein
LADAVLTLVPWSPGTNVTAYPRKSEQIRPDGPPTGVKASETRPVADDATLRFISLDDGEYWACAPIGDLWQYLSFSVESGEGKGGSGAVEQGNVQSFVDSHGDWWLVANARLDNGVWTRLDTTKFSYAMQWIVNGIIPGEELIDPIGGIVFWRCIPGANPIGAFASFGGWENIYLVTQYRDFVIGGQAIEIDGAGTFPFGRVIHAPEGTWLGKNAYADFNGRDDNASDSLVLGVFGDKVKVRRWPANQPKAAIVDLLTLDSSGNLSVAGGAPGPGVQWLYDNAAHGSTSLIFVFNGAEQFVIPATGDYLLTMSCQLTCSAAGTAVVGGIGVNGAVDERSEIWRESDNPANEQGTLSVTCVQHLTAGAVVRPMMRQTSGSTVTMSKATITAQRVG